MGSGAAVGTAAAGSGAERSEGAASKPAAEMSQATVASPLEGSLPKGEPPRGDGGVKAFLDSPLERASWFNGARPDGRPHSSFQYMFDPAVPLPERLRRPSDPGEGQGAGRGAPEPARTEGGRLQLRGDPTSWQWLAANPEHMTLQEEGAFLRAAREIIRKPGNGLTEVQRDLCLKRLDYLDGVGDAISGFALPQNRTPRIAFLQDAVVRIHIRSGEVPPVEYLGGLPPVERDGLDAKTILSSAALRNKIAACFEELRRNSIAVTAPAPAQEAPRPSNVPESFRYDPQRSDPLERRARSDLIDERGWRMIDEAQRRAGQEPSPPPKGPYGR